MKYVKVITPHGGFPEGTILKVFTKTGKTWNCKWDRFPDFGDKLYCEDKKVKMISIKTHPEEFL